MAAATQSPDSRMISFFRRALSSWIVLGLLGLIMIAFIVTGVNSPSGFSDSSAGQGQTVARVGDRRLGATDIARRIQNQVQGIKQEDPTFDMTRFVAEGGVERSVDAIMAATAVDVFGRQQGLHASRRLVDGEIASMPAFFGATGKFDQGAFEGILARERISERSFREDLKADLIRRMALGPIAAGAAMPKSLVMPYASLLLEVRQGTVGLVPAAAFQAAGAPSPTELEAFYRKNILRYTVPERRVLRYAVMGRELVAAKAKPSEADIAAAYKADAAKYAGREVRTLSQVILPDEAKAKAFAARVAAGTPFAKAATEAGFAAGDVSVGEQTRAQFTDLTAPAVADAAFKAASGATTAPTKSDFGWHVVHVDAVRQIAARPLDAVRGEITTALEASRGDQAMADLVAAVEDAIADGQSFDDVVKKNGLTTVTTPPLLADGTAPDQAGYVAPADVKPLLRTGFETATDEDPSVETIAPNQRYALLSLAQIVPAAARPLASIRAQVTTDFLSRRAGDRARAVAEAIVAKVNKGTPMAEAFGGAGVALPPLKPAGGQRLQIAKQGANVPAPIVLLFSMAKGRAKLEAAPNGAGWFVVRLDSIQPGDASKAPELVDATQRQFSGTLGQEYQQQFANETQEIVGAVREDKSVGRLKAELSGAAAAQ